MTERLKGWEGHAKEACVGEGASSRMPSAPSPTPVLGLILERSVLVTVQAALYPQRPPHWPVLEPHLVQHVIYLQLCVLAHVDPQGVDLPEEGVQVSHGEVTL